MVAQYTVNSEENEVFMQEALELAYMAQKNNEVPVGAVVVHAGKIIGRGSNKMIQTKDPTAHAEIVALREAGLHCNNYRLIDSILYVTLEPCVMCVGAMIHARLKKVVFGAWDKKTGAVESSLPILNHSSHNHQISWEQGPKASESSQLLKAFFKLRR